MSAGHDAMHEYLASLPAGIDSYPECRMKGAVVRSLLDTLTGYAPPTSLPRAIVELFEHPPAPSGWVPEVPVHALMTITAHDHHGGELAYLEHALHGNRALLDSLAFRILFRFVSPKKVLIQATERWQLFHAGTQIEVETTRDRRGGVLLMRTPPQHCPLLVAKGYAMAIRAAVEAAGGKTVDIDAEARSPTLIAYDVRWT